MNKRQRKEAEHFDTGNAMATQKSEKKNLKTGDLMLFKWEKKVKEKELKHSGFQNV